VKRGVCLCWHTFSFEELLDLTTHAEALGYDAVYVDGDVSQLASRGDADVLDGWTLTTALLARTERIEVGSIRLVHHWNAARLAQAVATLERIAPGRQRFLISIGGQPADRRFGLALPGAAERITWLDETLDAVRALWRGEDVTRQGRYVQLDGARIRPLPPPGRPGIELAAGDSRLLDLVATHADAWNVNLPPIASRVTHAAARLDDACRARGRDPATIRRVQWIFLRPHGGTRDPATQAEFLRWNPWFAQLPQAELADAFVAGELSSCRASFESRARELRLDLPVADLSGLTHDAARRVLDALRPTPDPTEKRVDPNTYES